ncbi:hypothetical protein V493_00846 [Pseudogymnoascus sp. VKM F-4281 (FW-2241)]|nr:hypothetical protein V493_00846 [Pseudogymnoascus sp. VKM F-4281 (FW-2241)]
MGDTTHRESSPTTHPQLSNIAMQLLKLQTNSDSPVTQLGLSHIAMQLQQFQTYHSEKEAELKKQISALEAKVKFQASEINDFTTILDSIIAETDIPDLVGRPPPSDLVLKEPGHNISQFQRLPDPIRQRIWRYTFPEPRIVQLFGTERILGLAGKTPLAMHICHDSRQEARSVYKGINMKQIPGGLDYEHDILYISTAVRYYSSAGLLSDITRWFELKDIRRIAFQYELWKGMYDNKEAFCGFLEKLKGLQELIIVLDDEVPAAPARRKRHVEFIHCGNTVREVIVGMVSRTLVDFGKSSLLSKIRYRKAVRQPVPTLSSKKIPGINSKFASNLMASPAAPSVSTGLSGDESYPTLGLPSLGRPLEPDPSEEVATLLHCPGH